MCCTITEEGVCGMNHIDSQTTALLTWNRNPHTGRLAHNQGAQVTLSLLWEESQLSKSGSLPGVHWPWAK